jgi:acyl carrier protein
MSTLNKLQEIFREVFEDDDLVIHEATSAADIEEWDSLMHVTLILEVEGAFKLRFLSGDVAGLKTVGDLCALIEKQRNAQ